MVIFSLGKVFKWSMIVLYTYSSVTSVESPVILFWLQKTQSWGHPRWGTNIGII